MGRNPETFSISDAYNDEGNVEFEMNDGDIGGEYGAANITFYLSQDEVKQLIEHLQKQVKP